MADPKIVFFFGAGASAFMGLPATEPLMKSFIEKHRSCNIGSIAKNYEKKNIENLYADVNELLNSHNMVLPHIPITCAANKMPELIEACEDNGKYPLQPTCDEHPLSMSLESASHFESVQNMLEQLKHSLGKHVFESLKYDKNRLSDYGIVTIKNSSGHVQIFWQDTSGCQESIGLF